MLKNATMIICNYALLYCSTIAVLGSLYSTLREVHALHDVLMYSRYYEKVTSGAIGLPYPNLQALLVSGPERSYGAQAEPTSAPARRVWPKSAKRASLKMVKHASSVKSF